jgi:hypothetical protein
MDLCCYRVTTHKKEKGAEAPGEAEGRVGTGARHVQGDMQADEPEMAMRMYMYGAEEEADE